MAGIVAKLLRASGRAGDRRRAVMLSSAEQVLALTPDTQLLQGLNLGVVGPRGKVGVVGAHATGDAQFEVRAFFPGHNGLCEDPVTGSLNAAVAQWLMDAGLAPASYVASQGAVLNRRGRVHLDRDDAGQVWVGGDSVTCISGTVLMASDVMESAAKPAQP